MILNGLEASLFWKEKLEPKVAFLKRKKNVLPTLAAIRVGEDPSSIIYLNHKKKTAASLSIAFEDHIFPQDAPFEDVVGCLEKLNQSEKIHGILIQLPLPPFMDPYLLISRLSPAKDVDGLHPLNSGKLFLGGQEDGFVPCTPLGCLALLKYFGLFVAGKEAVVVGRSILVGRPLGALLLQEQATVTTAHSHTENLEKITSRADFLFVAAGKKGLIGPPHVKLGACVIDIGMHRVPSRGKIILEGDVNFEEVRKIAKAITPVPGGVGPMTVMGLMYNTLKAAYQLCGLTF